jgi:alanine racemase
MVRPGAALYGYYLPFERAGREVSGSALRLDVKPVLTWKTRILSLRDMRADQALGYGGTYVTKAPTRIAILPVGYADGFNRHVSSRGRVIVREHYAPIVGRISMDLTLVDVTGLPGVSVGDEVILLGSSDGLHFDASEHAALANTILYEILCGISKRVPRRYNEQILGVPYSGGLEPALSVVEGFREHVCELTWEIAFLRALCVSYFAFYRLLRNFKLWASFAFGAFSQSPA